MPLTVGNFDKGTPAFPILLRRKVIMLRYEVDKERAPCEAKLSAASPFPTLPRLL